MSLAEFVNRVKRKAKNQSNSPSGTSALGLKRLVDAADAEIDIIAVHGLNGHRDKSWTAANGVNWLQELLPLQVPKIRVFTYGYDAATHSQSQISTQFIHDHATSLVSDLVIERKTSKTERRPIIFVAHSLGGLVVKSALIHSTLATANHLADHRSIKLSTYGIIFLGTPHQGGEGVAWGQRLIAVASMFIQTNSNIIRHLDKNSEWLNHQSEQYSSISNDFVTKFGYETVATELFSGKSLLIVPKSSAVIPGAANAETFAIAKDHRQMIRFASSDEDSYRRLSAHLSLMVGQAAFRVHANWSKERLIELETKDFEVPFSLSGMPIISRFEGRKSELASIRESFVHTSISERKTVVLHGMGGIGKSQLALRFARTSKDEFSAVFCFRAATRVSLLQDFDNAAKRIPRNGPSEKLHQCLENSSESDSIVREVLDWLSIAINHKWLLIFDDAQHDESEHGDDGSAAIHQFLPQADHGSIIVTTRHRLMGIMGSSLEIKQLSLDISMRILSNEACMIETTLGASNLAERLHGLPLALVQAGRYINETGISPSKYLDKYSRAWQKLHDQAPTLLDYTYGGIHTTWIISFEEVRKKSAQAANMLKLWAFLDAKDLWYGLLTADGSQEWWPSWLQEIVKDEFTFLSSMKVLLSFSMIQSNPQTDSYSMHAVLHDWCLAYLNKLGDDKDGLTCLALSCVGSAIPVVPNPHYAATHRRLFDHALWSIQFFESLDMYTDALPDAIQTRKCESVCKAAKNIGVLLISADRLEEAEKLHHKAIQSFISALPPDHMLQLGLRNNLGNVYRNRGKMSDARKIYQESLNGYKTKFGLVHPATCGSTFNLGTLCMDLGELDEAERLYQQALTGQKELLGLDHPHTIDVIDHIGIVESRRGNFEESMKLYDEARSAYTKVLGAEHESTLGTLNNIGNLLREQHKLDDAEKILNEAYNGYQKTLGFEHHSTWGALMNLGLLYRDQGRLEDARRAYQKVLNSTQPGSLTKMRAAGNMGFLYLDYGMLDQSEILLRESLDGLTNVFGDYSTEALEVRFHLALLLGKQGKFQEGEHLARSTLQSCINVLGPTHPNTIKMTANIEKIVVLQLEATENKIRQEDDKSFGKDINDLRTSDSQQIERGLGKPHERKDRRGLTETMKKNQRQCTIL